MCLPEVSPMITPRLLAPRSLSKENWEMGCLLLFFFSFFFLGLSFAQKMSFVSVILSYSCRALFLINEVERAINKILNIIQHTSAAPSSSPFPPSSVLHSAVPVNLLNLCSLPEPTPSRHELYTCSFSSPFIQ